MIVDVPTADDFRISGTDFLNIAWETVVDLSLSLAVNQEIWIGDDDEVADEYWNAAQRPLATALSLVQQGTEFLLKGHIADTSPYLLLSGDSSSWASRSRQQEVRFSEFKTIEAQDLVRVCNTVKSDRLPDEFQTRYESLRSKRNTIMHTFDPQLRIKPKDLLIEILEVCHHLISPKYWMKIHKSFVDRQPKSILDVSESILSSLILETEHMISLLQPAQVIKYFNFNKKQRCYFCPYCYRETADYFDNNMPKLSQLLPNESSSTSVYCFVCDQISKVSREDCKDENCPGNVISLSTDWISLCLTCGEEHT